MDRSSDSDSPRSDSRQVTMDESWKYNDLAEPHAQQQLDYPTEEAMQQLEDGKPNETVRNSLSNFRQSASRTTGQIRELLETSKALDRDLVSFLNDPQTRAALEGLDDEDDDDNNLIDIADDASSDNPKEIEALKQKTKSLKRKLRKWRKAARMALSEICPDISTDAQGDMTPGTMKNVLQKIRQLKSLTDRQTSIILTLTGQCETQKTESDEKDALIMELLRNCNGIRPALVKNDQTSDRPPNVGTNVEGMITKRETVDYPLITASEVEEVLTQNCIQFGSAHLIPTQINRDAPPEGGTNASLPIELRADHSDEDKSLNETDGLPIHSGSMGGLRRAALDKTENVWLAVAVGAAAGMGSLLFNSLHRRRRD